MVSESSVCPRKEIRPRATPVELKLTLSEGALMKVDREAKPPATSSLTRPVRGSYEGFWRFVIGIETEPFV